MRILLSQAPHAVIRSENEWLQISCPLSARCEKSIACMAPAKKMAFKLVF